MPLHSAHTTDLIAFVPRDRAAQIIAGAPLARDGIALIADIAGFTALTEMLTQSLSPAEGAEELTQALNSVFTPLIGAVHAYGGEVHKFGGDALICWFPRQPRTTRAALLRRTLAAALRMQTLMRTHGNVHTRVGAVTLSMKIGAAYGPALRVRLGDITHGYEDVLGGLTLDRMAEAEHLAQPGEVLLDPLGLPDPKTVAVVVEQRAQGIVMGAPLSPPRRVRPLTLPAADTAALRELRAFAPTQTSDDLIIRRITTAELKPVVSMFVQFEGLQYEAGVAAEAQLGVYFHLAQRAAARYGGRVNRLLTGDKGSLLHLIFGAPQALEELELRAARCALELRELVERLPFISAQRIGMSVGRAFAGLVGAPERHDYTVMGATINRSARLMQAAQPGQIVLDTELAARVETTMHLALLGPMHLKGIADPVELLALEGERGAQLHLSAAQAVLGRDTEYTQLRTQLAQLQAGQGGACVLLGELGMGKSHLLAALRSEMPVAWLAAQSRAYGGGTGSTLAAGLCRAALDLPNSTSYVELLTACTALLGPRAGQAAAPFLARLIGVPLEERQARELAALAGESLRWRLRELVRELILAVAAQGPLVLALDDLQWADAADLDLLPTSLHSTADTPLLWILAARPDPACNAWQWLEQARSDGATWLELTSLSPPAATQLLQLHAPGLPAESLEQLAERSGGNPLFLVELARAGALAGPDAALPDTIQGLLLAQLDRLPAELRTTLQRAAILGHAFDTRLLGALEAEADVTARLDALLGAGFLLREGSAYTFRHSLLRESTYDALLFADRRYWHGRAATALERLYPTEVAERAAELALHYERAEQVLSAARYYAIAADAARLLDANDVAETGYRHVLALLDREVTDTDELRSRTLLKLAQVRMNAGDYAAAQALYDEAFTLIEHTEAHSDGFTQRRTARFRMAVAEPTTLDPGLAADMDSLNLVANIYEGLVDRDEELNIVPGAARRWHVDDGGRRYTFELRPNLHWSDGTRLTAAHFVAAWRRNLHPDTNAPLAHQLYAIRGAAAFHNAETTAATTVGAYALADDSLVIELDTPQRYLLYTLAQPIAAPLPNGVFTPAQPVGNGPYMLTRWRNGHSLELAANPQYHSAAQVRVPQILARFHPPGAEPYENRTVDWCRVDDAPQLAERHPEAALTVQYLATYFLGFNCARAPFDRPEVRRALAHCIDQAELTATRWAGLQQPATGGVVPPGIPGHSPAIGLPYDPAAGRALLAAAGATDLRIRIAATADFGQTPEFLQRSWQEQLHIHVELTPDVDVDSLFADFAAGAFDALLIGWEMDSPNPLSILGDVFHSASDLNVFDWHNSAFDRLIEAARAADGAEHIYAACHQADQILIHDAAIIPLYYPRSLALLRPTFRLHNGISVLRGDRLRLKQLAPVSGRGKAVKR